MAALDEAHAVLAVAAVRGRSTSSTQGPAALTSAFARAPRPLSGRRVREADRQPFVVAPRGRQLGSQPDDARRARLASSALRTTNRASSTQQSENSNALRNSLRIGAPSGARRRSSVARRRQLLAPAQMVVEKQAEPTSHAGRCSGYAAARSASAG